MKKLILITALCLLAVAGYAYELNLTWTAPADDGAILESGPVESYILKYSTAMITPENFDAATVLETGDPKNPGEKEEYTFQIPDGNHYYFAIKSVDPQGNVSAISNIAERDFFAPGAISDLE